MNIYVASSWRNAGQPAVVQALRNAGHEVYDFREPSPGEQGFSWSYIDPLWQDWKRPQYIEALEHPIAELGYAKDFAAMKAADCCVLVQPCGRSAHVEAGWFAGQGKPVFVLLDEGEAELMYKAFTMLFLDLDTMVQHLNVVGPYLTPLAKAIAELDGKPYEVLPPYPMPVGKYFKQYACEGHNFVVHPDASDENPYVLKWSFISDAAEAKVEIGYILAFKSEEDLYKAFNALTDAQAHHYFRTEVLPTINIIRKTGWR